MSNLTNFRSVLYALKVRQGQKITLRHIETSDFDAETGEQTINSTTKVVYKAVVGTQDILRVFGPHLGADYGGAVDHTKRFILIDKYDLPRNHVFTRGDQIEINGEQWRIEKLVVLSHIGYFIEAEQAHE